MSDIKRIGNLIFTEEYYKLLVAALESLKEGNLDMDIDDIRRIVNNGAYHVATAADREVLETAYRKAYEEDLKNGSPTAAADYIAALLDSGLITKEQAEKRLTMMKAVKGLGNIEPPTDKESVPTEQQTTRPYVTAALILDTINKRFDKSVLPPDVNESVAKEARLIAEICTCLKEQGMEFPMSDYLIRQLPYVNFKVHDMDRFEYCEKMHDFYAWLNEPANQVALNARKLTAPYILMDVTDKKNL